MSVDRTIGTLTGAVQILASRFHLTRAQIVALVDKALAELPDERTSA